MTSTRLPRRFTNSMSLLPIPPFRYTRRSIHRARELIVMLTRRQVDVEVATMS